VIKTWRRSEPEKYIYYVMMLVKNKEYYGIVTDETTTDSVTQVSHTRLVRTGFLGREVSPSASLTPSGLHVLLKA